MISRLMISLKKAATVEEGWSLSEMTTPRRVDEMRFVNQGNSSLTRPSLDPVGYRARKGFQTLGAGDSDQLSTYFSEEIGMAVTPGSED
jgi:hypothetical protein